MYWDKDSRGLLSIMELTPDEFETIRRALLAFSAGMATKELNESEPSRQYIRASKILRTLSDKQ